MSSSSSSSLCSKVFLSFRGEDTRKTFVSHLYKALDRNGIHTFKDDIELEKGKSISPEILKAIEQSRFSIVVISKNYVSSSWCLDELVKIIGCMETMGQQVIPVFYDVDPSHVKQQAGSFAKAFAENKNLFKKNIDKVQRWREALTKVATISGWDSRNCIDESKLIDDIVREVSDRLSSTSSSDASDLVGIDSHLKELDPLLCIGSDDVRMVGIWGMGGIGKTTVARVVYDQLSSQFEGRCFLENVKEDFKKLGPSQLQEKLLKIMLLARDLNIWSGSGSNMIKERLSKKKVLLVLDDVDEWEQLNMLAKNPDWFGSGSRVIITTRNKRLLEAHEVKNIYEVQCLGDDHSLQLFEKFAFTQKHPEKDLLKLSTSVVKYVGGLPLALKVLGSYLRPLKEPAEWERTLSKVRRIPPMDVMRVLRISYDGLDEEEKAIFLYVACLFNGEDEDHLIRLLDGCGFYTKVGIRGLIDKCLITISEFKCIQMHDMLQEMGRNIVHEESPNEPGGRKMLWNPEDISYVLTKNTGTEIVEGISLNMCEVKSMNISAEAFTKMRNLKFLKFYNKNCRDIHIHLPEGLEDLSSELRYLHWDMYPLKSLPLRFRPEYLVELMMPHSHVERLWDGIQPLINLKRMDLSECVNLIEIPDVSNATNFESLILEKCESLVEVPSSIGYLHKLNYLSLNDCKKLRSLPSNINLRALTTLNLDGCSSLNKFPEISCNIEALYLHWTAIEEVPSSIKYLSKLVQLRMSNCSRLKNLPSTIGNLTSLEYLNLDGCTNITKFPEVSGNMKELCLSETAIEEVPSSVGCLSAMKWFNMRNCTRLMNLPSTIGNLTSLEYLILDGCTNITKFPEVSGNLKELCLSQTAIEEVPSSVGCLSALKWFHMRNCTRLKNLPSTIGNLTSLEHLNLDGCTNFTKFPEVSGNMKVLYLSGTAIEEVPSSLGCLSAVNIFYMRNCKRLKSLPSINLKSLRKFHLSGCSKLESFPEFLEIQQLPSSIMHLTNLKILHLSELEGLEVITPSIKQLSFLFSLDLSYCKRLQSLPELPGRLQYLHSHDCTSLQTIPQCFKQLPDKNFSMAENHAFSNCFKLDRDACNNIMENSLQRIQHMAKQYDIDEDLCKMQFYVRICLPGDEVPLWFSYRSRGSSITIQLPPRWSFGRFLGFAFCVVVAVEHTFGDIRCKYRYGEHESDFRWEFWRFETLVFGSDHMLIFYKEFTDLLEYFADDDNIVTSDEVSFEFYPIHYTVECKVKSCGVRLVYAEDGKNEYKSTMMLPGSSSYDPMELSSKCGVINENVWEQMLEEDAHIEAEEEEEQHLEIEAEPCMTFSFVEEEEEPHQEINLFESDPNPKMCGIHQLIAQVLKNILIDCFPKNKWFH